MHNKLRAGAFCAIGLTGLALIGGCGSQEEAPTAAGQSQTADAAGNKTAANIKTALISVEGMH